MNLISKKEAKSKSLKKYFTGIPCKYGHVDQRYTYNGACISCALQHARLSYKRNPAAANAKSLACARANTDKEKNRKYITKYGITQQDVHKMLEEQNHICLICDKAATVVDHCHKTGKVRGMLCRSCNSFLGRVENFPERLAKSIEYINRYREFVI